MSASALPSLHAVPAGRDAYRLPARGRLVCAAVALVPWLATFAYAAVSLPLLERTIATGGTAATRDLPTVALTAATVTTVLIVWFGVGISQLIAVHLDRGFRRAATADRPGVVGYGPALLAVSGSLVAAMAGNLISAGAGTPLPAKIGLGLALAAAYVLLTRRGGCSTTAWRIVSAALVLAVGLFA